MAPSFFEINFQVPLFLKCFEELAVDEEDRWKDNFRKEENVFWKFVNFINTEYEREEI